MFNFLRCLRSYYESNSMPNCILSLVKFYSMQHDSGINIPQYNAVFMTTIITENSGSTVTPLTLQFNCKFRILLNKLQKKKYCGVKISHYK